MKFRRKGSLLCLACSGVAVAGIAAEPVPLGLEEAYDLALASDQSIQIAYWEVRKANLLPWSALTRLGPQLAGDASYGRQDRMTRRDGFTPSGGGAAATESGTAGGIASGTTGRTTAGGSAAGARGGETTVIRTYSRTDTGKIGLTFQQPLIDLTVFPAYRYGKLSAKAARLQHQFTIRGVLYGVVQAYFEVLKQERVHAVNRQTLSLAEEQRAVAQKRADVGEVTRSDVLRATVAVETARRALIESENLLLLNRNTLANILNLDPATDLRLAEPPGYPRALPPFAALVAQAYARREDLRVAEIAVEQDIALRGEIAGEYGPRVVAEWNGDLSAMSGTQPWSHADEWAASVAVQIPFFSGGQRELDLQGAARKIQQTRLDCERVAKQIQQEAKQAWLTVRALTETLKALRAQVDAAAQGYSDLQAQYRGGTATSVDVLSSLNELNAARRDFAVQTLAYEVALRNLEQVGGVFQEQRVQRAKIR